MGTTDLQPTTANADDYSPNELIIRIRLLEPDAARSYVAARLLDELWDTYVEMEVDWRAAVIGEKGESDV